MTIPIPGAGLVLVTFGEEGCSPFFHHTWLAEWGFHSGLIVMHSACIRLQLESLLSI